jgi:hypothetical protein
MTGVDQAAPRTRVRRVKSDMVVPLLAVHERSMQSGAHGLPPTPRRGRPLVPHFPCGPGAAVVRVTVGPQAYRSRRRRPQRRTALFPSVKSEASTSATKGSAPRRWTI